MKTTWNIPSAAPDHLHGIDEDPLSGDTIRAVRHEYGWTQTDFAELVDVSLRTVKAWEHPDPDNSESRNCTGPARKLIQVLARKGKL